jgi:hypothetical protein
MVPSALRRASDNTSGFRDMIAAAASRTVSTSPCLPASEQ